MQFGIPACDEQLHLGVAQRRNHKTWQARQLPLVFLVSESAAGEHCATVRIALDKGDHRVSHEASLFGVGNLVQSIEQQDDVAPFERAQQAGFHRREVLLAQLGVDESPQVMRLRSLTQSLGLASKVAQ
jgi:hypothetical protein